MPLPQSTLTAGLVPDKSYWPRPAQTGGKYKTSLGPDLVPPDLQKEIVVKPPAAPSNLAVGALVPQSAVPKPPPDSQEPAPPKKKYEPRANLPPPPPPPPPAAEVPLEVRPCIFTGDDLPAQPQRAKPTGRDVAWEVKRGRREHRGENIYNQEDIDVPWAPQRAPEPESMRILREKKRMVMPETLGMLNGFGKGERPAADADVEANWSNERVFRQWDFGRVKGEGVKKREEADKETANAAVSAYGERLPPRAKGDVFAPWAPRG